MPSNKVQKLIDIKVDYGKSITQLAELNEAMQIVEKQRKQLSKSIKDGSASTAERKQHAALEQQLKNLKGQYRDLTRVVQNTVKSNVAAGDSLAQLRARLSLLTREFDNMAGAQRRGAAGIQKMLEINKVTNAIKDAEKATQRFYRNVGNYTSAMRGIKELTFGFRSLYGVIGSIIGGLSLREFSMNLMNTARAFEDGIARVRSVLNPTMQELAQLDEKARDLGRETQYTATQVANSMEVLSRNGFVAEETLDAITPTLELAQANVIGLAEAADISSRAMRAFGLETTDLYKVNDVLSATCANSATNITQLGEAMKNAAPAAATAKMDIEETAAALGTLANIGIRGEDAGTGIKMVLTRLSSPEIKRKAVDVLKHYGLTIDETTLKTKGLIETLRLLRDAGVGESTKDISLIVGQYAARPLQVLIQNLDTMEKLDNTVRNSFGETTRMFGQSLGDTTVATMRLQSAWESFLIDFYKGSGDYLIGPMKTLTNLINTLAENIGAVTQTTISLLAGFAFSPAAKHIIGFAGSVLSAGKATFSSAMGGVSDMKAQEQIRISQRQRLYKIQERLEIQYQQAELKRQELHNKQLALMGQRQTKTVIQQRKALAAQIAAIDKQMLAQSAQYQRVATLLANNPPINHTVWQRSLAFVKGWGKGFMLTLKGIGGALKAAFNFVWPMLLVTAIAEVWQAVSRYRESLRQVAEAASDIKKAGEEAVVQNSRILYLERIKKELDAINAKENKNAEDKARQLELEKAALGLLGRELKANEDINVAIKNRIAEMRKLAMVQAYKDIYAKDVSTILELGTKYSIYSTDPSLVQQTLATKNANLALSNEIWQHVMAAFGVENLEYDIANVLNPAWARIKAMEKFLTKSQMTDALKPSSTATPENTGNENYGFDPYTFSRNKSGTTNNLVDEFNRMMTKWTNKLEETQTSLKSEGLNKQLSVLTDKYDKTIRELDTLQNADAVDSLYNRIMKSDEVTAEQKENLKTLIQTLRTELKKQHDREMEKLRLAEKSRESERSLNIMREELSSLLEGSEEQYNQQRAVAEQEYAHKQIQNRSQYETGAYGDNMNLSPEQALQEYQYRKSVLEKIDDEAAKAQLDALDKQYAAVLRFYDMERIQKAQHELAMHKLTVTWMQKNHQIEMSFVKEKFERSILAYKELEAAQGNHYKNMEFGSSEYWERLKKRIGEENAIKLQMQYETAVKEEEQARAEYQKQEELGLMTEELKAQLNARIIAAETQQAETHIEINKAIESSDATRWQAASDITGGLIKLSEELGQENEAMAKLSKVLALANIAISTGEAIAKMVSAESGKGIVGLPTIAAGIATILTNIATAISTVKSAKFAKGKVNINGPGTSTSDSIPAQISRGESVINARATEMFAPLLMAMNAIGNGVAIPRRATVLNSDQMTELRESFRVAVAEIRPIVDVQEISQAQNRVSIIRNLGSV